ncbi:TPA: hypothetical protein HA259_04870 [Thermoplasmata archaeon]|nr:hypothetical protein [Thermoplasmata archaeon]
MTVWRKCPFYESKFQLALKLAIIGFGAVGLSALNVWVSAIYLAYSLLFFLLIMPLRHCRYCFYAVRDSGSDGAENGVAVGPLAVADWVESYLEKHVECGKRWSVNLFVLWIGPIVLIVVSFFLDFSILAVISLIGFVSMLAVMAADMKRNVCPTCAIRDECHASF